MFDSKMSGMNQSSPDQSFGELLSSRFAPTSDWESVSPSAHFAQFYETDEFISGVAAEYIIKGLRSGETCIIAATARHIKQIEKAFAKAGLDVKREIANGNYIVLDAVKTLSQFMVSGMPDAGRFETVIGKLVGAAANRGRKIRIFGEMVGVLCSRGQFHASLDLEDLWNVLRSKYSFSLFCAYPLDALMNKTPPEFVTRICKGHAWALPGESYANLPGSKERLQKIALLQQRNKQLEAELVQLGKKV